MQSQVTTFLPSFLGGGSEGCSLLAAFLAEPPSNAEPGDYFFSPFLGVLGVGQEGEEHKVRVGGGCSLLTASPAEPFSNAEPVITQLIDFFYFLGKGRTLFD